MDRRGTAARGTSLAGLLTATVLVAGLLMACDGDADPGPPGEAARVTTSGVVGGTPRVVHPVVSAVTSRTKAERAYAALNPAERIGQLFMVGVPSTGTTSAQRAKLKRYAVGNVYLSGNTTASRATVRARVAKVRAVTSPDGIRPFVSVDQEGGQVQRLRGSGFSRMPSAKTQGTWSTAKLRLDARTWGRQLAAAGVTVDLAPVADVVPAKRARSNQPIGRYDRQYGSTPSRVAPRVAAFVTGMQAGGVSTTVKHFPGLGRASGNTDVARGVTDPTTRTSTYLRPFASGVHAGTRFLMVSSATYPNIDARRRACFSSTVMRTMVRGSLDFDGVIVSDDLAVVAFSNVPWGDRATRFLAGGGTMILSTTPAKLGTMTAAVRDRAAKDPAFARTVKAAVLTVLETKAKAGLLR